MNESELESYKSYSEQTAQDLYQEMIKKAAQLSEEFGKEIGEKAEQEARKFYQQMLILLTNQKNFLFILAN